MQGPGHRTCDAREAGWSERVERFLFVLGIIRADVIIGLVHAVRLATMLGADDATAVRAPLALYLVTGDNALTHVTERIATHHGCCLRTICLPYAGR